MLPSPITGSISADRHSLLRMTLQAAAASWSSKMRERLVVQGKGGYLLNWITIPIFQLAIAGLVYRGTRPQLLSYAVVGIAASTFVFNSQYFIGEILDGERRQGTLIGLFLTPCPRLSWLTGFAFGGLLETLLAALSAVAFGTIAFGVRFHPDWPALVLTFLLFLSSLWGLGFIFSAIGLVLKRSNDLSNLLSPFFFLLGGIYYPVALLPVWLRLPARALPLGYGVQALSDASLHGRSIVALAPQILPLAAFAVLLPAGGVLTFRWLERLVRVRGELDLY